MAFVGPEVPLGPMDAEEMHDRILVKGMGTELQLQKLAGDHTSLGRNLEAATVRAWGSAADYRHGRRGSGPQDGIPNAAVSGR